MSGINLHLDDYKVTKESSTNLVWVDVANMINTRFAVDMAAKKVVSIVTADRKVCDALNTLRSAKSVIRTYGASESIMCVFNAGNTLSDVIGMEIPEITASNAKSVGIACCENIDETIVDAYAKVKDFFNQIVESAGQFFDKLKIQASCQSATIENIIGHITNADKIDARDFSMDELYGYTQPVFMDRVSALQYISDNIGSIGTSNEELNTLAPYLKILGYKLVEKANESLLEGDSETAEPALVVEPETPAEQQETAPDPATVMNPQPVSEPEPTPVQTQPQPALTGDPAEVISTEEPAATPTVTTTPATPEGPADVPQTQSMAVFRWTPSNIMIAASAVQNVLKSVPKFATVHAQLSSVRGNVVKAVEAIQVSGIEDKTSCDTTINSGRSYASFIGDVMAVYSNSMNELVDQIVSMAGKVVAAKSEQGVRASAITEEDPFGVNAEYQNAEEQKGAEPEQKSPAGEEPKGKEAEKSDEPPATEPDKEGETKDSVETPENVPNDQPVDDPAKGVDPNGEPHPGKAPHVEPTETPEGEQQTKKAETMLGDIFGTRMW